MSGLQAAVRKSVELPEDDAVGSTERVIAWPSPHVSLKPVKKAEARRWMAELDKRLAGEGESNFAAALARRPELRDFLEIGRAHV